MINIKIKNKKANACSGIDAVGTTFHRLGVLYMSEEEAVEGGCWGVFLAVGEYISFA